MGGGGGVGGGGGGGGVRRALKRGVGRNMRHSQMFLPTSLKIKNPLIKIPNNLLPSFSQNE